MAAHVQNATPRWTRLPIGGACSLPFPLWFQPTMSMRAANICMTPLMHIHVCDGRGRAPAAAGKAAVKMATRTTQQETLGTLQRAWLGVGRGRGRGARACVRCPGLPAPSPAGCCLLLYVTP